jgi:hypothetical protein
MVRVVALFLLTLTGLSAQSKVPQEFRYHRVWAVVPFIGSGTRDDPRRPMFVPSPAERQQAAISGERPAILSYTMQMSDDGKSAIVEFVGANPDALKMITQSSDPNVKAFERGNATKEQVEAVFKQYKRNFNLDSFAGKITSGTLGSVNAAPVGTAQ